MHFLYGPNSKPINRETYERVQQKTDLMLKMQADASLLIDGEA
jgi:hypothetical protein